MTIQKEDIGLTLKKWVVRNDKGALVSYHHTKEKALNSLKQK